MTYPPVLRGDTPPLDPSGDEAQQWVLEELAKQDYQAAKPTLWDRISKAFLDWIGSLFGAPEGTGPFGLSVSWLTIVLLVLLLVGIFFLIFRFVGSTAKSSLAQADAVVFLDGDERSVRELRAAAKAATDRGDFALAASEQFRAIARSLGDRTVIVLRPGSTAHHVEFQAAKAFPSDARALATAASVFDRARYFDKPVTEPEWRAVAELDTRLESLAPSEKLSMDELAAQVTRA